ncbi:hypothetical protein O0L34_g16741 [Tuta absoluta]|nr:hypothetical protein O0L34_g16741 [Tuta absoluta]
MSQSDEGRAARIAKYKEERRKQLTARTAALFSSNVTDRRTRRNVGLLAEESTSPLKSSSELNLNTASTSVPIRTTRTSRLRAAATHSESSPTLKKSHRSSSAQSLEDTLNKPKPSKAIERDKTKVKRLSNEKENYKSASTTCVPDKDIGAKTKPKHSISKTILERDKSNFIAASPKRSNERNSKLEDRRKQDSKTVVSNDEEKHLLLVNGDDLFEVVLDDSKEEKFDDLYNSFAKDDDTNLPGSHKVKKVVEVSVVPNEVKSVSGLLGAVCVPKVERFSELLSNLCSPCEAEILFEDILLDIDVRKTVPECSAPCRRLETSPKTTSTPKRTQPAVGDEG